MENTGLSSSSKPVEHIFPWKKAWQTLRAIWPQLVYISIVCMSIPQYLLFCISTQKAAALSQRLSANKPISFENGLHVLQEFGFHYISVGWIICVLFFIGVYTAIALSIQSARGEPINTSAAFRSAIRSLFPKGLAFLLLAVVAAFALLNITIQILPGQLIRFLGLIAGVLLSALPVLMILAPRRPAQAFKLAMSLRYTLGSGMSKWSVFFLLLTYQLLALNAIALMEWLCAFILEADLYMHVPRSAIFQVSTAFPFGKLVYGTEAIFAVGLSWIVMGFVVLNTSFVYELYRRHTLGRTIDIIA